MGIKMLAKVPNSAVWIIAVVLSVIALGLIVEYPDKISSLGSNASVFDVNSKPTFDQHFFECVCDLPNVTSGADCGYFQYLETEDPGRLGLVTFATSGESG
jgi:hypothetical protein